MTPKPTQRFYEIYRIEWAKDDEMADELNRRLNEGPGFGRVVSQSSDNDHLIVIAERERE